MEKIVMILENDERVYDRSGKDCDESGKGVVGLK